MQQHLEVLETEVLRKLALLAEGQTLDYDRPTLHRVHPGSTTPPGFAEAAESDLNPGVSLCAYHARRLSDAAQNGFVARLTAITEAEKDFETALRRPPTYNDPDSEKNAQDRDEAILRWVGKRPEEVAVWESCSYSYVRKVRRLHKRDQRTGEIVLESVA